MKLSTSITSFILLALFFSATIAATSKNALLLICFWLLILLHASANTKETVPFWYTILFEVFASALRSSMSFLTCIHY
jgi:hypothetical protein